MIGPECTIVPVLKADAYGLGLEHVADVMAESGIRILIVGSVFDGIDLRKRGLTIPIVILGSYIPGDVADKLWEYDLVPTIWDLNGATSLSQCPGKKRGAKLKIFVKVDTGMHRLGVDQQEAVETIQQIRRLDNIEIEGIYTHFSDALSDDQTFTQTQIDSFRSILNNLENAGLRVKYKIAAATPGLLMRPDSYMTGVDPARAVYGILPPGRMVVDLDLRPALRAIKTRIIQVRWISEGEGVGYRRLFRAARRTLIGVLPLGWGDGMPHSEGHNFHVLVRGKEAPIIGAASLEHCVIDLTDIPDARPGDEVVVVGSQGSSRIGPDDVLKQWGTNNRTEVVARFKKEVTRIYYRGGSVIGYRTALGATMPRKST